MATARNSRPSITSLFKFNLDGGSSESSWYWKCLVPAGRCGLCLFQGPLYTVMGAMLGVGTQDGGCVMGAMVRLIPGLVWHLPGCCEFVWELLSYVKTWRAELDIRRPGLRLGSATSSFGYYGKSLKPSGLGFLLDQDWPAHSSVPPTPPASTADTTHYSKHSPRAQTPAQSPSSHTALLYLFQWIGISISGEPISLLRLVLSSHLESLKSVYKIHVWTLPIWILS